MPPADGPAASQLVGRKRELVLLDQLLSIAEPEPGMRCVELAGVPGVGTTTIARAHADAAQAAGWAIVVLDGRTTGALTTSGARHDRSHAHDDVRRSRHAFASALRARAGEQPLLVVVDHVDDVEPADMVLLDVLADPDDPLAASTAITVVTRRGPADSARHLIEVLGIHLPVPRVDVESLAHDAVSAIVVQRAPMLAAAACAQIVARAGGSPLAAVEMAAAPHIAGAPVPLRDRVSGLLTAASDVDADAARIAALAGMRVPLRLIASDVAAIPGVTRVLGDDVGGPQLTLISGAVRDAIIEATPAALRRAIATELAASIESDLGVPADVLLPPLADVSASELVAVAIDPPAATIAAALHAAAGDHRRAVLLDAAIARSSELAGRPLDAIAAWSSAHRRAARSEPTLMLEVAYRRAMSCLDASDEGAAIIAFRELLTRATEAGSTELVACAAQHRAFLGDPTAPDDSALQRIVDMAPAESGWPRRLAGWLAFAALDEATSVVEHEAALAFARRAGDRRLEHVAREKLAVSLEFTGAADRARELLAQVAHDAAAEAQWRPALMAWTNLVGLETRAARPRVAASIAREAYAVAIAAGQSAVACELLATEASAWVIAGACDRVTASLDDYDALAAVTSPTLYARELSAIVRVQLADELDQRERASRLWCSAMSADRPAQDSYMLALWRLVGMRHLLHAGDLAGALAQAELIDVADGVIDAAAWLELVREEQIAAPGEAAGIREARRRLEPARDSCGPYGALVIAEVDAHASGDPGAVVAASTAWRDAGYELESIQTLVASALVRGDVDAVSELRRRSRACGARRVEGRCNVFLRDHGVRAPASTGERGAAPLTERELEIATLVAADLRNADIAARLGIAPATVARMLANVYRRHGISGRVQLVHLLREHDLLD